MGSFHTRNLERVLSLHGTAADPEVRIALSRLATEIGEQLRRGSPESKGTIVAVSAILQKIRGPGNGELRTRCLIGCAHYLFLLGDIANAIPPARAAMGIARAAGHNSQLRKALVLLGALSADFGQHAPAIEYYAEALQVSRQIGDEKGEAVTWMNLGVALQYASQHEEAIECLKHALDVCDRNPAFRWIRTSIYSNLALSHYYREEFELGIIAAEESERITEVPSNASEALSRTINIQNFSQLLLASGDLGRARTQVSECRRIADVAGTPRADLYATSVEGMLEVLSGNPTKGIELLETVLARSKQLVSMIPDALIALIRAHDELHQPEIALQYLNALQEHIRSLRSSTIEKDLSLLPTSPWESNRTDDLQLLAMERRESMLRAKIAENELFRSRFEMLERLAVTADLREDASGEHGYRVGKLASLLAQEIGWKPYICERLDLAARLHDIGKVGVPDRILLESEALKEAERNVMSSHTVIGSELLSKSNMAEIRMAEEIALCHHEWWDGTGYPSHLKGKRIPAGARITALADVFDAMTHGRPYEQAWSVEVALEKIAALSDVQFDPDLTERFIPMVKRLKEEHEDLDAFLGSAAKSSPFLQARSKIRQMLLEGRLENASGTPGSTPTLH